MYTTFTLSEDFLTFHLQDDSMLAVVPTCLERPHVRPRIDGVSPGILTKPNQQFAIGYIIQWLYNVIYLYIYIYICYIPIIYIYITIYITSISRMTTLYIDILIVGDIM